MPSTIRPARIARWVALRALLGTLKYRSKPRPSWKPPKSTGPHARKYVPCKKAYVPAVTRQPPANQSPPRRASRNAPSASSVLASAWSCAAVASSASYVARFVGSTSVPKAASSAARNCATLLSDADSWSRSTSRPYAERISSSVALGGTHPRPDAHQRVMQSGRLASRADARVELDGIAVGGSATEDRSTENAADIRVGESPCLAERETGNRGRGVRADPGKRVESRNGARQRRVHPCDAVQVSRAPVVPEAGPLPKNVAERCARQRAQGRKARQKPSVRHENARHLRLLEHHLAHQYAVWVARLPPWKVAARAPVPGEDAPAQRRRKGQRVVQFRHRRLRPVEC